VGLWWSTNLLVAMQGLRGLHTWYLNADCLHEVCQLTGLRELDVVASVDAQDEWLLQLTQLKQLTALTYIGDLLGARGIVRLAAKVSWALTRNLFACQPSVYDCGLCLVSA
jgi:hypothetical protein